MGRHGSLRCVRSLRVLIEMLSDLIARLGIIDECNGQGSWELCVSLVCLRSAVIIGRKNVRCGRILVLDRLLFCYTYLEN